MHLYRTCFFGEVVVEFLPPKHPSTDVVILCDGLPSGGSKQQLVQWFAQRNFWTFHLRYRGTWESGGMFLDHSPEQDVLDVIKALHDGFKDIWSGKTFSCQPEQVCVVGSSFGGTTALMASLDDSVDRVLAISPVIDWTVSADEPMDWMEDILQRGYVGAYRFTHQDWLKLSQGEMFQPLARTQEFDPSKIFLMHAHDDRVVPIGPTLTFTDHVGCAHQFFKTGGHHLRSKIVCWPFSSRLLHFLRSKK